MDKREDGGQAFPGRPMEAYTVDAEGKLHATYTPGMSLRDYFAAKALPMFNGTGDFNWAAEKAYEMADAMLKAREQ